MLIMSAGRYTHGWQKGYIGVEKELRRTEANASGIGTPQPTHMRACDGAVSEGGLYGVGKSAKWLGRKALIRQSFVITARLFLPRSCSFLSRLRAHEMRIDAAGRIARDENSRQGDGGKRRLTKRRRRCVVPTRRDRFPSAT